MKIYLVGGAVRDTLLKKEIKDKDFVVTGSTIDEMLSLGFEKVGADFPVFIHPETSEEYALARTEIKDETKKGYHAFITHFSPETTLEEDLKRRDLTINAIAYSKEEGYIDPYHGIQDLENKILRHTSLAFKDDPVRVLRLARFYARYEDFTIAEETKKLCQEMVLNGELEHLTSERVWKEFEKVFTENKPSKFFYFLQEIGALKIILPELDNLKDVPQPLEHHPENCSFIHTMMVLDKAAETAREHNLKGEDNTAICFSALVHDLGKALTPKEEWPHHRQHEERGEEPIKQVCDRLKVQSDVKRLALMTGVNHLRVHKIMESNPKTITRYFTEWDYNRRPHTVKLMAMVCEADSKGRLNFEDRPYPQNQFLIDIMEAIKSVDLSSIFQKDNSHTKNVEQIKSKIYNLRLRQAKETKQELLTSILIDNKMKLDLSKLHVYNKNNLQ